MFHLIVILLGLYFILPASEAQTPAGSKSGTALASLQYIDTSFENASPLWYEAAPDGPILVYLMYDHERSSPNRAAGHFHFRIHAKKGSKLTLEFKNLDNVWNSQKGSVARELKAAVISQDGKKWNPIDFESLPENRVRLNFEMPANALYVARVEPYRISDLDRMLDSIKSNSLVQITTFGKTVQGRDLEIVRIGNPTAPFRVFIRARAHPWESGGNWVVQGLIQRLLKADAEAKKYLDRYCVYILPMANKDGVATGRTRFNMLGKDLNRDWDKPADRELSPENFALEKWLESMIARNHAPHLAIELHNDGSGRLHISRPQVPNLARYLERMKTLEHSFAATLGLRKEQPVEAFAIPERSVTAGWSDTELTRWCTSLIATGSGA